MADETPAHPLSGPGALPACSGLAFLVWPEAKFDHIFGLTLSY